MPRRLSFKKKEEREREKKKSIFKIEENPKHRLNINYVSQKKIKSIVSVWKPGIEGEGP